MKYVICYSITMINQTVSIPSAIQISCSWLRSWKRSEKKKDWLCLNRAALFGTGMNGQIWIDWLHVHLFTLCVLCQLCVNKLPLSVIERSAWQFLHVRLLQNKITTIIPTTQWWCTQRWKNNNSRVPKQDVVLKCTWWSQKWRKWGMVNCKL